MYLTLSWREFGEKANAQVRIPLYTEFLLIEILTSVKIFDHLGRKYFTVSVEFPESASAIIRTNIKRFLKQCKNRGDRKEVT